jgi:ubiquinol-cytochrome c reductase iron-sulfur subunit
VSDVNEEQRMPVSITTATADDPHMQPLARNPERTERFIAFAMLVGLAGVIGFGVAYWYNADPWVLGVTLGGGVLLLGFGITAWGKYLMPKGPFVEERHALRGSDEEREAFSAAVVQRTGGILGRRKLLGAIAGAGLAAFGVVFAFPLIRSLGPLPKKTLDGTDWRKGSYLVDSTGRKIHKDDIAVGGIITVFPKGFEDTENGQAVDQTVLIRVTNEDFTTRPGRESWGPNGYLAYSKLCSHLGCPVGLYEQQLKQLVCPCHQSMFDVTNGCEPNFGPAPRPLPQLPIYIDSKGFIRSQSGYLEPVGPGFWERS